MEKLLLVRDQVLFYLMKWCVRGMRQRSLIANTLIHIMTAIILKMLVCDAKLGLVVGSFLLLSSQY